MSNVKITVKKPSRGAVSSKELYHEIVNSVEKDPRLYAEIKRLFQVANRRIQNIEATGKYSPALAALGKPTDKYSKFSVNDFGRGVGTGNWEKLKYEYGKCYAFLMKDTSTATGTRDWNEREKKKLGLTDAQYELLSDEYMGKISSVDEHSRFYELFHGYDRAKHEFTEDMRSARDAMAELMERESQTEAERLQRNIDMEAARVANESANVINSGVDSIFDGISTE